MAAPTPVNGLSYNLSGNLKWEAIKVGNKNKPVGSLEVIRGCMFAGKTEELIRRIKRLKFARQTYLAFKPALDNRYSETEIASHNGETITAHVVSSAKEILAHLRNHAGGVDVVAIDEAQFFGRELVKVIQTLIGEGYRVIVAGLDTDFRGEPFGPMGDLLAIADEDIHLKAICTVCGRPANMTQRLIDGEPANWDDPVILVGHKDHYEARCREHHVVRGKSLQSLKSTL